MSIRAYKIKEIEFEKIPSFNLSDCDLAIDIASKTYNEGREIVSLYYDKDKIEYILNEESGGLDEYERKTLLRILEDIKDEDYVEYMCY